MTVYTPSPCYIDKSGDPFEHILSSSNEAILIASFSDQADCDQPNTVTYSNDPVSILTGYTSQELRGIDPCSLIRMQPSDLLFQKIIESAGTGSINLTATIYRKDLLKIPVELTIRTQEFDDIYSAVIIIRPTVENKQLENASDQLSERPLLLADKMTSLSTLVSGMAHEINNPNNLIMLSTDILREVWDEIWPLVESQYQQNDRFTIHGENKDSLNQNVLGLFDNILSGSERISKTITAIRDFIRDDTGDKKVVFDIQKTMQSAISITDALIKRCCDNFQYVCDPQISFVYGYQRQIQQAFINLITNACQALTEKSQKISIAVSVLEESQMVCMSITDEGEGIAPENMNFLFDPFYTTRRAQGHLGLGLSATYTILKKHGGSIDFTSHHGFETKVTVKLPISKQ
jgi:signal transduction histidine kinase